jgi:alpha-L-fucosidase
MDVNGEGIFGSRPWKIYGEGPSTKAEIKSGGFNEDKRGDFTAEDVRFTTKGKNLYAFVQGWPKHEAVVKALGTESDQQPGRIAQVSLLGAQGPVKWTQTAEALKVQLPEEKISTIGLALKVEFA